jgi:2-dehydro-3-deoxygalactonokinase
VHLGSHTKLVRIDSSKRIGAGVSTLAGELLHLIQEQTILRSSLSSSTRDMLDSDAFLKGWANCQRFGLSRVLFQIRLLDLHSGLPKEGLFSFLAGAMLHEEFQSLFAFVKDSGVRQVVLSGLTHLQPAWTFALEQNGFLVKRLRPEETEQSFLVGLLHIFERHRVLNP